MPCPRPARRQRRLCLGFVIAATALGLAATDARAQLEAPDPGVLNPQSEFDNSEPPRFDTRKPLTGNPSGSGAGRTGYVAQKPPKEKKRKPAAARPLPPVVTTRVTAVRPIVQPPAALPPLAPTDPVTTAAVPHRPRPKPELETDPYEPLGIRAGSFILKPAVELSGGYDSNPNRVSNGTGSGLFILAPELKAKSDWERHEFRADLRGSYTAYSALPDLNRPYFQSVLDGRIDWTSQTRINLQNRFLLSTDTPGSPDFQANVAEPTIFTNIGGSAGVAHRFNRFEFGGKLDVDRTRYQDSLLTDGTHAGNEDRDFTEYGFELRGSYEFTPALKTYAAVAADTRIHDLAVDRFGYRRDSTGLTPRIGSTFELSRQLKGDVSVGYTTRSYEDPRLEDLAGFIADASLIWSATALTTATLSARSSVYESTQPGISGVLARDFGLQVDHAFRHWLIATLKFGFGFDDYAGSSRTDSRFVGAAALTYKVNPMVHLKGELRHEQRSSSAAGQDYTANIFLLGLRLQR